MGTTLVRGAEVDPDENINGNLTRAGNLIFFLDDRHFTTEVPVVYDNASGKSAELKR